MTKKEVKQEHKQSEGDPMMKGAIRSRQLAAARNRMMADVPRPTWCWSTPPTSRSRCATTPTKGTPRVVAKGAGVIAARIRELRREPAGRRWSRTSRWPGRSTPAARSARRSRRSSSQAVAQVLAFVISLRATGRARRTAPQPAHRVEPLPGVPRAGRRVRPVPADSSGPAAVGR